MKKSLAMMLALIMVCALPGIASAKGNGSIERAVITHEGGYLKNAVSIDLKDITFEESVKVELYSDETLLTTATLKEGSLKKNTDYENVTCCIPTEGADDAWSLTPWIPRDEIVPNKAVLFVDDQEMNTMTFKLDAEAWAALPGTAFPYSGSIERAGITHANGVLKNAVSVDLKNVNFESSVQVQLYSGETLLTTATLQGVNPGSYGFLTCCIATETADANWALTPWTPKDDVVPDKAVLVVDGHELNTKTFTLDAEDWANLPGTVLPPSGSIERAGITHDNGTLKNAVSIDLKDITFAESVQVKLFSGDTLLTTATLKGNILSANTYYKFVTCCIPTVGEDDAWSLTPWIPRDNIIPTKAVLFVDDHEMDTEIFTLNAKEWADLPGTASPSYNGGTTGGGSHWHPPVTPAPVPVVVIPPKTGDMTIWQSILHFFGVI